MTPTPPRRAVFRPVALRPMAKSSSSGQKRVAPRALIVLGGAALGAFWGFVMWGITTLAGQDSGLRGLTYLMLTTAMIGCGVAAFFGAFGARKRGERVTPRFRRKS
jgi:hypothetical protein